MEYCTSFTFSHFLYLRLLFEPLNWTDKLKAITIAYNSQAFLSLSTYTNCEFSGMQGYSRKSQNLWLESIARLALASYSYSVVPGEPTDALRRVPGLSISPSLCCTMYSVWCVHKTTWEKTATALWEYIFSLFLFLIFWHQNKKQRNVTHEFLNEQSEILLYSVNKVI